MESARIILGLFLLGSLLSGVPAKGQQGEWRFYGGDATSSHYSPVDQINKTNVGQLQIAWTWDSGDKPMPEYDTFPFAFEATPLMIGDFLYLSTPYHRVVALDAGTGKQLWNYDPRMYEWGQGPVGGGSYPKHRGLATWTDGTMRRIFLPSRGRLMALDAETGKLIPNFGREGVVDLTEHLVWKVNDRTHFANTSPPVVYNNLVIVGSYIPDLLVYPQSPPGDVQAFDARTGAFVWSFHTIPQAGEFGNDTWEDESWKRTGHVNVWTPMALDEARGLLYMGVSSPANDYYGGERKGNNLFSGSLVCLDAKTGKRVWHFQTVHHDLWDYDGVMTPNLVTIHVEGKTIDAVTAVSKTGFTYVFDRVTGEPVWPIEERPVPQTDLPGEQTSPTQPFPTKPPPFAKQGFTPDDVVDFTPEIKAMALEVLKDYRYGPVFNPPSLQGSIFLPSQAGGADWGAGSVDPNKGILYVRGENTLKVIRLQEQDPNPEDDSPYGFSKTPYKQHSPLGPTIAGGLFLNKPPYATLNAIDLNKGEILWQVPIGDNPAIHNHPLLKGLNLPPVGRAGRAGTLVTAGGLVINGPGDDKLYALDQDTGKVLWAGGLPHPAAATPMTYRTRAGRQFIVVATGFGPDSTLVAFALPEGTKPAP